MIKSLLNDQGLIYAYIEYEVLDSHGQFKDGGEYCYIQDVWIHDNAAERTLNRLISKVDKDPFMDNVKYVYWKNLKHNERQTRAYIRKRLAKLGEKND